MNIDMYLFIEKGLRAGISYITERYSDANNKYMKNYDPKKLSKFITYLDLNNLYGWAMSGYLPYSRFKWLMIFDKFDVNSISKYNPVGCILEVDLKYPDELYVLHNNYPLAPEKPAIPYDILSDYCKRFADEYEIKVGYVKKSIPNLGDKTNYVVHYKNLQLHFSLGMKLTKIHRVLRFKQSDGLKYDIDFNTEKRSKVANSFEEDIFKLMISSVYGKKMEHLQSRINVRLIKNEKIFQNTLADQLILLTKHLIKIMLLFMK